MTRKKVTITRSDVSELRPKKIKKFNLERFLNISEKLRKAIKKEEKLYGGSSNLVA